MHYLKQVLILLVMVLVSVSLVAPTNFVSAATVKKVAVVAKKKTVVKKKVVVKKKAYVVAQSIYVNNKPSQKELDHPMSKCLTKDMVAARDQAMKRMEKDITEKGQGHELAVKTYRDKMATIVEALALPYCGYGSGIGPIKKTLTKSVERTRAEFLVAVK